MTEGQAKVLDSLSNTSNKYGSYNFMLGIIAVIVFMLLTFMMYIVRQNSEAIGAIPRDLGLLNQKLDSMDKKLDLIFMDKFEIKRKEEPK
ncbi:MAG: hypothetical protein ACRC5T_09100 [Cetobacterium sp.]